MLELQKMRKKRRIEREKQLENKEVIEKEGKIVVKYYMRR